MPISGKECAAAGVRFGNVETTEYSRCLGDHPDARRGPALALDWEYKVLEPVTVDDFESSKTPMPKFDQYRMPGCLRADILLKQTSATKGDILKAMRSAVRDRRRRVSSYASSDFEEWIMTLEWIGRKIRRWRTGMSKKQEQELMLEAATKWRLSKLKENKFDVRDVDIATCETLSESSDSFDCQKLTYVLN